MILWGFNWDSNNNQLVEEHDHVRPSAEKKTRYKCLVGLVFSYICHNNINRPRGSFPGSVATLLQSPAGQHTNKQTISSIPAFPRLVRNRVLNTCIFGAATCDEESDFGFRVCTHSFDSNSIRRLCLMKCSAASFRCVLLQ